ncbi:hypothetical protein Cpir12675_006861 [Ceratocystis pirilliformis]|uniref:Uncharacterized protein n=1 Tax=Ceratocystis pirilliformis TaxID=259994 RepID=A0ABR3YF32_9PEZI
MPKILVPELQDGNAVVDPTAIKQAILDTELPAIDEVPYSEWSEEFQKAIIITKASALFDSSKMEYQISQLLVAEKTRIKELKRCAPRIPFKKKDTHPEMLCIIHERSQNSKVATAVAAFLEITSQRLTSLEDLARLILYLQPV